MATSASREPLLARLSTFYRHLRATIKTILATPDSRKIYFFLCLNLAYMFVQMAYGIWTNSLGLISDCERGVGGGDERWLTPLVSRSHPHVLRLLGAWHGPLRERHGDLAAQHQVHLWVSCRRSRADRG